MENCGPHCYALGDDYTPVEGPARRCLTRVFHENKALWLDGSDLKDICVYCCRHAKVDDSDVDFLGELPPASIEQIESIIISFCDVTDSTVELVAKIVKESTKIRTVIIQSRFITEHGYVAMAKALETNTSLRDLVIYNPAELLPMENIHPLFSYALVVNPDRPVVSNWSFTHPKASCGGDYQLAREVADGISFVLDRRDAAKKKNVRAAKIVAQVPTVCFRKKMSSLRKYRRDLKQHEKVMNELRQYH